MTTAPIQIGYCQCGCGHSLSGGSLSYLPYHGRHFYKRKEPKWEVLENGCWKWLLYANNKGYGIWNHAGRSILAHVVLWERRNGPVPAGLELDHLCRNRLCVNPDHLEAVTHQENISRGLGARRTHCPYGHPLSGTNLRLGKDGHRYCKACCRLHGRLWARRKRNTDAGNFRV